MAICNSSSQPKGNLYSEGTSRSSLHCGWTPSKTSLGPREKFRKPHPIGIWNRKILHNSLPPNGRWTGWKDESLFAEFTENLNGETIRLGRPPATVTFCILNHPTFNNRNVTVWSVVRTKSSIAPAALSSNHSLLRPRWLQWSAPTKTFKNVGDGWSKCDTISASTEEKLPWPDPSKVCCWTKSVLRRSNQRKAGSSLDGPVGGCCSQRTFNTGTRCWLNKACCPCEQSETFDNWRGRQICL